MSRKTDQHHVSNESTEEGEETSPSTALRDPEALQASLPCAESLERERRAHDRECFRCHREKRDNAAALARHAAVDATADGDDDDANKSVKKCVRRQKSPVPGRMQQGGEGRVEVEGE